MGKLNQTVCEGRFAVVNMSNNTEITDLFHKMINFFLVKTKIIILTIFSI